eukprot:c1261_g1_i1.p1 GENE.c1261_g1_i1~~c1261_g1_i1.p1  ORF type:complete len:236 (+),score=60.18 c1261_g1_i1:33-710(+)
MAKPPADVEDDLADLQKRYSLLQGDMKAYFEAALWTQEHNTETIKTLRGENKQLREQLTRARRNEDNYAVTQSLRAEVRIADSNVAKIRKQYDVIHARADMLESYKFANVDKTPPVTDDSVVSVLSICEAKLVRLLEDSATIDEHDRAWQRGLEAKLAAKLEAALPAENLRVVLRPDEDPEEPSDDLRDDDVDDDHVATRADIQKLADRHFQEASRKQRNKRRRE